MILKHRFWIAIAIALPFFLNPMKVWAVDPSVPNSDGMFLDLLNKIVQDLPDVQDVVNQIGNTNNIRMARGMCSVLDDAQVDSMVELVSKTADQNFFGVPAPRLIGTEEQRSQTVVAYLTATTMAAVPSYCAEHKDKVDHMFQSSPDTEQI